MMENFQVEITLRCGTEVFNNECVQKKKRKDKR